MWQCRHWQRPVSTYSSRLSFFVQQRQYLTFPCWVVSVLARSTVIRWRLLKFVLITVMITKNMCDSKDIIINVRRLIKNLLCSLKSKTALNWEKLAIKRDTSAIVCIKILVSAKRLILWASFSADWKQNVTFINHKLQVASLSYKKRNHMFNRVSNWTIVKTNKKIIKIMYLQTSY